VITRDGSLPIGRFVRYRECARSAKEPESRNTRQSTNRRQSKINIQQSTTNQQSTINNRQICGHGAATVIVGLVATRV
jgi:hypothetical protein